MTLRLLLPFKGTEKAKSRWELDAAESRVWALELLDRSIEAASRAFGRGALLLVTPDAEVADRYPGVEVAPTSGAGLNEDLECARVRLLGSEGVERLGVLLPDLPQISTAELYVWWEKAKRCELLICPDRSGAGTNSVCMSPADAVPFLFEGRSAGRYLQAAQRRGMITEVLSLPGLSEDCDSPEDLSRWVRA